ncbi:MAG: hypothetical protein LUF32_02500 [Clostridiales bacterium]|nr:hypothetical protein [Clostridiales bacterium]
MKKFIFILVITMALFLTGCENNEVESNIFPLAIGIETEEESRFHMYAAYPDLEDPDAADDALSKDAYWEESLDNLSEGSSLMSKESSRNADMNHLKVLILDVQMLDDAENTEALVQFFREKSDIAWNSYVLLTDGEMEEIFSEETQLNSCLGIYLEDLLEGWENLRYDSLITVGDLVSQYYNRNEILLIPLVSIEENQPLIDSFAVVSGLRMTAEMSLDEVFESNTNTLLLR